MYSFLKKFKIPKVPSSGHLRYFLKKILYTILVHFFDFLQKVKWSSQFLEKEKASSDVLK